MVLVILGFCITTVRNRFIKDDITSSIPISNMNDTSSVQKKLAKPESEKPKTEQLPAPGLAITSKTDVDMSSNVELPDDDIVEEANRALRQLKILSKLPPATDGAVLTIKNNFPRGISKPSISNDGKYISFVARLNGNASDAYVYSLEDQSLKNLTEKLPGRGRNVNGARFSPDGRMVLVSGFPQAGIWTIDIQTGNSELLVDNPRALGPNWSYDSRYITYSVAEERKAKIEIFDIENSKVVRTIAGEGTINFGEPSFSPDGKSIVYVKMERKDGKRIRSLVIEPLDSTKDATVLTFPDHDVHTPVYSPDGQYVAYKGGNSTWGEIYTYSVLDKTEKRITTGSGSNPHWLSDSKSILFESKRSLGLSQIYKLDLVTEDE